jgi:hypothetical protein
VGQLIIYTREESLADIFFEIECLNFFAKMKNKYKCTLLGFEFNETYDLISKLLNKMIRQHNKDFNEKLTLTLLNSKGSLWK